MTALDVSNDVDVDNNDGKHYMLTTIDNPYNPFTQYDEWLALDTTMGYHTPGLLARYVVSSDELSFQEQENSIQIGINEIIRDNPYGMYRKVSIEDFKN